MHPGGHDSLEYPHGATLVQGEALEPLASRIEIDAAPWDGIYAAEDGARYFASKISIGTGLLNK